MSTNLRLLLATAFAALSVSCGSCIEHAATPVTFRVTNTLPWAIYVHDEFDQLGTVVQRREGDGSVTDLRETAACSCEECESACGRCTCFGVSSIVRRIAPGQSVERTWLGEFREDARTDCAAGGSVSCLGERRPAQPGAYRVKVCYGQTITGAPADAERFPAELPTTHLTCATADFEHPAEGVVEVKTVPPASCRVTQDCPAGQLCQNGRCSADCLPHEVPALGADWNVEIGGLDDRGFFDVTDNPDGSKTYKGTGKVTTVRYTRGTTNLELFREGPNGLDYTAGLYYVLPKSRAVPIAVGSTVELTLVLHRQDGPRRLARGLTLKQNGVLLLAADTGIGGRVLDDALLAPFRVDSDGVPFACNPGDCGRRTHRQTTFASGERVQTVDAGKSAELELESGRYEVVAIGNYVDAVTGCGAMPVVPYVIMQSQDVQR
ncbi:MAG: hypothetical protein ACK4N5_00110 [Myxococcales bacterium]